MSGHPNNNGPPTVVKVGGSLYDLPDLGDRLSRWLATLPGPALLVPGGGPTADAIRQLDRVHRLGEEAAHWLALHALSVNAGFLARLLPGATVVSELPARPDGLAVLDPYPFFRADERHAGRLPHAWEVTTDSLAARVAGRAGARELVLLKSVTWDDAAGWAAASQAGVVDGYFPRAVSGIGHPLRIRTVNLRA
jgi:aspartokinase-like uncharacterized kinase